MAMNFNSSGTGGTTSQTSSNYSRSMDYASGQNAANEIGNQLEQEQMKIEQLMLKDPMAAVASANRIRRLQAYLSAYKTGQNLGFHEVIPQARLAGERFGTSTSTSTRQGKNNSMNFRPESEGEG